MRPVSCPPSLLCQCESRPAPPSWSVILQAGLPCSCIPQNLFTVYGPASEDVESSDACSQKCLGGAFLGTICVRKYHGDQMCDNNGAVVIVKVRKLSVPKPSKMTSVPSRFTQNDEQARNYFTVSGILVVAASSYQAHNRRQPTCVCIYAGRQHALRSVQTAEAVPRGARTLCLLYTSPSPRDATLSRMPSSA